MLLTNVRIHTFRTIGDASAFKVSHKCALVGPNNAGKTNILQAIQLAFSLHPGVKRSGLSTYSRSKDFPRFVENDKAETTITLSFNCKDNEDQRILKLYNKIKDIWKIPRTDKDAIAINIRFSEKGKPTLQLFPSKQLPSDDVASKEVKRYYKRLL